MAGNGGEIFITNFKFNYRLSLSFEWRIAYNFPVRVFAYLHSTQLAV